LADAAQQVLRFFQAVSSAARRSFRLFRSGSATHIVGGLFQAIERLLHARVGLLIVLAALAGSSRLPGGRRRRRAVLRRLRTVAAELLHLPLQLFCFAAQHFLLPALLGSICRILWLLSEFLLAAGQFVQFLQRFVDCFLLLVLGVSRLRGLVL